MAAAAIANVAATEHRRIYVKRHVYLWQYLLSFCHSNEFNPFTAKCGQRQISTKFAAFIF